MEKFEMERQLRQVGKAVLDQKWVCCTELLWREPRLSAPDQGDVRTLELWNSELKLPSKITKA